jgi:hypothetical protein
MHALRISCNFAQAGTYGHECGKPAVYARKGRSKLTATGVYWARRCASCADVKGGENSGLDAPVPYDPIEHANVFVRHYSID